MMEADGETKEVIEISIDSVLGELQSVLKGKITESDSSSDSSSESEEIAYFPKSSNEHQHEQDTSVCSNKTDEEKMVENSSGSPVSPSSFIERPIFYKSSIKKDPGSKLHDQLVKELGTVLKKRNNPNDLDPVKEEEKPVKDVSKGNNRRPGPPKANSVFANKALLAHLENHLKKSVHKTTVAGKPRSSVNDSSFQEDSEELVDIQESSIAGAAQFGVKLRSTQKRTIKAADISDVNYDTAAAVSPPRSPLESSQSEILIQARTKLQHKTGPPLQQNKGPSLEYIKGHSLQHNRGTSLQHNEGPSLQHNKGPSLQHNKGSSLQPIKGQSLQHNKEPSLRHNKGPSLQPIEGPSLQNKKGPSQNSVNSKTDEVTTSVYMSSTSSRKKTVTHSPNSHSVSLSKINDIEVSRLISSSKSDDGIFHVSTLKREGKHLTQINILGRVSSEGEMSCIHTNTYSKYHLYRHLVT